jgi:integrase
MASIIERNGRYLFRVRMKGFQTVTKTFNKKADGVAWARRVETDMEAGRWTENLVQTPTFGEVLREYRQVVAPKFKGASTYRYRFDEFEALPFAPLPITEVRAAHLARWRDAQLRLHKPATVTRKLAMLSSIFTWAAREREWVTQNPISLISKPRAGDSRTRTLTADEVTWLMAAARTSKATWLAAALTILLHSAMRRSELCGLKRADINFDLAVAQLADTKNGSARDVPLCPRSLLALRELDSAAEARGEGTLLPIGPAGSFSTRFKVTVRRAQMLYRASCAKGAVEPASRFLVDLRLHDLRHHAVTSWADSGVLSVAELMTISGHKTMKMLTRYIHLQPTAVAAKLAKLSGSTAVPGLSDDPLLKAGTDRRSAA